MIATRLCPGGIYLVRGIYRGVRVCRVIAADTEQDAINRFIDQLTEPESAPCSV